MLAPKNHFTGSSVAPVMREAELEPDGILSLRGKKKVPMVRAKIVINASRQPNDCRSAHPPPASARAGRFSPGAL